MTPVLLELPDDIADWPAWLERQLVGLRLAEFVDELGLIPGVEGDGSGTSLDDVLAGQAAAVLKRGLSVLSEPQFRTLLRQPRLLLELQERVLIDGGDYWRTVDRAADHRQLVRDGWTKLSSGLEDQSTPLRSDVDAAARRVPSRRERRAPWLAAAAALLVAVAGWTMWPRPAPIGWGWDRPGALALDLPADQYLNHLADSADEWFKKRPETGEALAQRLREFRHGCDTLIAAPHAPLSQADRGWLVERCKVWSGKLDAHLAELTAQSKPLDQVRSEADETIRKLIDAIRDRASSIAA